MQVAEAEVVEPQVVQVALEVAVQVEQTLVEVQA
jgi:hypothetical protein